MAISYATPGLGLQDTHLNVRMGLLTLIIIGEGVITVTRIVNKTVRPGGWTKWSFVHILGVTSNVVCLGWLLLQSCILTDFAAIFFFGTSMFYGRHTLMSHHDMPLGKFPSNYGPSFIIHSMWF